VALRGWRAASGRRQRASKSGPCRLQHRPCWNDFRLWSLQFRRPGSPKAVLRRLDHSMILVTIAGSYTRSPSTRSAWELNHLTVPFDIAPFSLPSAIHARVTERLSVWQDCRQRLPAGKLSQAGCACLSYRNAQRHRIVLERDVDQVQPAPGNLPEGHSVNPSDTTGPHSLA
jgi:hypothetical protein